jgi:hypothetical protein
MSIKDSSACEMVHERLQTAQTSDAKGGIAQAGSMYGRRVSAPATPPPAPVTACRRPRFEAQLFGGRASGWTVELLDLVAEIAVYLDGRHVVVVDAALADRVERGELLGVYRLVDPAGPETRYVGTAWS